MIWGLCHLPGALFDCVCPSPVPKASITMMAKGLQAASQNRASCVNICTAWVTGTVGSLVIGAGVSDRVGTASEVNTNGLNTEHLCSRLEERRWVSGGGEAGGRAQGAT